MMKHNLRIPAMIRRMVIISYTSPLTLGPTTDSVEEIHQHLTLMVQSIVPNAAVDTRLMMLKYCNLCHLRDAKVDPVGPRYASNKGSHLSITISSRLFEKLMITHDNGTMLTKTLHQTRGERYNDVEEMHYYSLCIDTNTGIKDALILFEQFGPSASEIRDQQCDAAWSDRQDYQIRSGMREKYRWLDVN